MMKIKLRDITVQDFNEANRDTIAQDFMDG